MYSYHLINKLFSSIISNSLYAGWIPALIEEKAEKKQTNKYCQLSKLATNPSSNSNSTENQKCYLTIDVLRIQVTKQKQKRIIKRSRAYQIAFWWWTQMTHAIRLYHQFKSAKLLLIFNKFSSAKIIAHLRLSRSMRKEKSTNRRGGGKKRVKQWLYFVTYTETDRQTYMHTFQSS